MLSKSINIRPNYMGKIVSYFLSPFWIDISTKRVSLRHLCAFLSLDFIRPHPQIINDRLLIRNLALGLRSGPIKIQQMFYFVATVNTSQGLSPHNQWPSDNNVNEVLSNEIAEEFYHFIQQLLTPSHWFATFEIWGWCLKKIIKNQSLNPKIPNPLEMKQNCGINTVLAKSIVSLL